ncbi:FtsK/SpoIIIE family DNA translocase [Rhizorhapis sp. SPR117]|uniref:FtsK/SpoIIIE family DNA translocase n=1 Tax=Rhizorhapis sp. SPR117 TaxID=2912611 RepID=UPI001F27EED3|nr:DNA translocase FtsK 4TM domain-containing protein [Rhizorhapis sp. SPR117]
MAGRAAAKRTPEWREMLKRSLLRSGELIGSILLFFATIFLAFALLSYQPTDPSMNTVAGGAIANMMGAPGAWIADFILWLLGVPGALLLPLMLVLSRRMWGEYEMDGWRGQLGRCLVGIFLIGLALSLYQPEPMIALPAGWGGVIGLLSAKAIFILAGSVPEPGPWWLSAAIMALGIIAGSILWYRSLALERPLFRLEWPKLPRFNLPGRNETTGDIRADSIEATPRPAVAPTARPTINIQSPQPATRPQNRDVRQEDLFGNVVLPSPDLLAQAPANSGVKIDKASLERNARLLESVLDDFHVKGHITEVRPGPVVTMYELEPASGIKASRVIQLAEDIARNMSALSARVATIPGRTVIGIELPNVKREAVVLHELISGAVFADQNAQLPLILGKNINGDPVIADLAPMPHLLIAGTTGSGKSVGLNCMILSLLYRLTPDQCKMIMIDPKMLELSIYDDIPHLLAPVVTEPAKAIRALKWAVEQMEDRYRMMASVGVRNLANFNEKVGAAKAKGKPLGRRVQTGYDHETGQPIYEEEQLDFHPLAQIVVIIDELADLMMTAGKEVEFLIQRLAQKARAAGIHLIMATQRPSVDVITGVIKANLPTRISFHVTSKIDSRTILGEQGAEQLLGKGDMLYMPGGKQITRVHGPFVSDDEVRAVADHWRAQGQPDYNMSVTEEPEDGGFALDGVDLSDDSPDAQNYRKACQLVFENQKASTSWLQRQLRIGYNSAARLIERMENEGLVGAPNHVGRREVLMDENGQPK